MKKALVAALLFLAPAAFAARDTFPNIEIPYQKYVLPNGLTLIVHEDHKSPLVAVNVIYKVGSRDERPGRSGFAHLFEHLMFNGSEHYNDEFFRALTSVGAVGINGTTSNDRTTYYETVPSSALDRVLWLESDRMGYLLAALDQKKLDEQRGVVQNEKRQGEAPPYGKLEELITVNTFPPGHPYSWTTIGSMSDINAATLEDVKDWFRTWYGAANAVLVIAGDVNPADVKTRVEHYFGDVPAGPPVKRLQSLEVPKIAQKRIVMREQVPQTEIHKIWNVPGVATRDATLLYLAAGLLESNRETGRLYERLMNKESTATSVTADLSMRELGSQLDIAISIKPGADKNAVERALDEELNRLMQHGPSNAELELLKTTAYAPYARMEGVAGKASLLASAEVSTGSPESYKNSLRWIRDATPADIKAVVKRWLGADALVLEMQPAVEQKIVKSEVDRTKLPDVGPPPVLNLPPLQRATLSNGLKIAVAERHSAPVVQVALIADAGFAADAPEKPGIASLTMAMVPKGTAKRSVSEIVARSRKMSALVDAGSELDSSFVSLNALTTNLDESLDLFSDVLLHPSFPESELESLKTQALVSIDQAKTRSAAIASLLMTHLIFGEGHAYSDALSGIGSRESVAAITRDDLQVFHRRWIRPDNSTLLVVGDVTLEQIRPLLEKHLREWRIPSEPLLQKNLADIPLQQKPRVFLVDHKGAEQSFILAAHVAPRYSDPDYSALRAAGMILGGGFLSRLNMNLREDKHWAYGVSANWERNKGPGWFNVSAPVQTDKTAEAMQEILKEVTEIREVRPPSEQELAVSRDNLVLKLPMSAETVSGVAQFYYHVVTYSLAENHWSNFVTRTNDLTSAAVQTAARKLVHPEALTWIVVGDLAKIEESVRKLNFGQVEVVDAEGKKVR